MRRFLLGVLTGVVAVAVALVAVVLAASQPGGATASPAPSGTATPTTGTPPRDLRAGETWLETVELDSGSVLTPEGPFRDVRARGSDVRMSEQGLGAGTLRLDATLPFDAAARQIGQGVQLYAAGAGRAGVRRTASFLGRTVVLRATGSVTADRGQLVIEPETVDLGGPGWLDAGLSAAARRLVTVRHTVQGLPQGMHLTRVSVVDSGFRAHLEGRGVVLAP